MIDSRVGSPRADPMDTVNLNGRETMERRNGMTRRRFLRRSAATAGGVSLAGLAPRVGWTAATDTIRVGVIGCGNRGAGAAKNAVEAAPGVQIVALADVFADRIQNLKKEFSIPDNRCFVGLDAYRELLAVDGIDMAILAAPPAFRPAHFTAAVEAGKHMFVEKPVAVCPTGIHAMLEAAAASETRKLSIAAGTQRRHEPKYRETIRRIHDGAIGEIVSAQCYWNQGDLWVKPREPGQTDLEWQLRNWLYFVWTSGDHIVEQHIHNIDVINWAFNALPEQVHSIGGRQWRTGPEFGNVYDHFGTEFFYANDVRTMSMCRQIKDTTPNVSERVVGTKGSSNCAGVITGENPWIYDGPNPSPFVEEHRHLIESIRGGAYLNEARQVTESTLTAVMARESCYSRQQLKREWFIQRCDLDLTPPAGLTMATPMPVAPVAVPGVYHLAGMPMPEPTPPRNTKS